VDSNRGEHAAGYWPFRQTMTIAEVPILPCRWMERRIIPAPSKSPDQSVDRDSNRNGDREGMKHGPIKHLANAPSAIHSSEHAELTNA